MPITGLFSRLHSPPAYQVRPATHADWPHIEWLLARARDFRLSLEWRTLEECVGSPTLLLAINANQQAVGLIAAVTDDGSVAWLRAVVLAEPCLSALLDVCLQALITQGAAGLAFLGNENWITHALRQADLALVNQVITLQWDKHSLKAESMARHLPDLVVRPVTPDDVGAIAAVDQAAFEQIWRYGSNILRRAMDVAAHFVAAYLGDVCVGYQFSTLVQGKAHIVRLATHPGWRGQGIGGRLLAEALNFFEHARPNVVTVNTQQDNQTSLRLYHRFGFREVDRPLGVWFRQLPGATAVGQASGGQQQVVG